jgi:hypothetical protein
MSDHVSRWGVLKDQYQQKDYEKLELLPQYRRSYQQDNPLDLDRKIHSEHSLLSNLFEDMSMSTNTGPPSYDVIKT